MVFQECIILAGRGTTDKSSKNTGSRDYPSGRYCNKTPETPDLGQEEEDEDDEDEALDKLGPRNQKKGGIMD